MKQQRRTTLALLAGLTTSAMLSACGFRLRGAEQTRLPFQSIYLGFAENSPLGIELRRYIDASGGTQIVNDPKLAQATLQPLAETRNESVLSLNSQGRIRELSLMYRFTFQVKGANGKVLLAPTEIALRRDMSFNEAQALAKEGEKAMLYRDMQSDLVQQILRRLAALQPA